MRHRALLSMVLVLVAAAPASAHVPRFPTPGARLADPAISYAAYGRLTSRHPAGWVSFRARAGHRLPLQLLTPVTQRVRVRPQRVVIQGPDGYRRVLEVRARPLRTVHEGFSNQDLRVFVDRTVRLPRAGAYRVRVAGRVGARRVRYVLVTGSEERFSAADIAAIPASMRRIQRWYRTP